MSALMHYFAGPGGSGGVPSLLDRIWQRVRTAIRGPVYDVA